VADTASIPAVLCDYCRRNTATTTNMVGHRIRVSVEEVPFHSKSGWATCLLSPTPFDRDLYFCNRRCLRKWLDLDEKE
jgi:hypothetical protein